MGSPAVDDFFTASRNRSIASVLRYALLLSTPLAVMTLVALVSFFRDRAIVERMAQAASCQDEEVFPCHGQMLRWAWTPISHTFHMRTRRGVKQVRCEREYLLAGAYRCARHEILPLKDPDTLVSTKVARSASRQ